MIHASFVSNGAPHTIGWCLGAIATCACGRLAFDPRPALDAERSLDATLGPFGMATLITELGGGASTDDPTLSRDELEIMFGSTRAGGVGSCDLWSSTRLSIDAAWANPVNVAALNTPECDASPMVFGNDLGLRFARDTGLLDLFETTRLDRTAAWQPAQPIASVNAGASEFAPTATQDDLLMVFSIFGGVDDLVAVSRSDAQQPWSMQTSIGELNAGIERSAHLSGDGLTIWFVSDRPGGGGGGQDLWVATRLTRTEPFGTPSALTELNTADDEDDPWVSEDRRRIYFARFPPGSSTAGHLFYASR